MVYRWRMSTTSAAPPRTAVLFRHRRRPPYLQFGLIGALFLIVSAFAADAVVWQALLVLGALAAAGIGIWGRSRIWVEDQLITDEGVAVVRPDGEHAEIPFDRLVSATRRGASITFLRDDGRKLGFVRNTRARRMRSLLAEVAPQVTWVDEVDLACNT